MPLGLTFPTGPLSSSFVLRVYQQKLSGTQLSNTPLRQMHGQELGLVEEWRRDWAQGKPGWTETEQEAGGELSRVSGALQSAYMKSWVQSPGLEENEIKNQSS